MPTLKAQVIHTSIDRDHDEVYAFASQPENMPRWATGLASGLERDPSDADGLTWLARGVLGSVRIRFAPLNTFGVVDHTVTLPSGQRVENALRVVPNGTGSEVLFVLLRQPEMTDAQFAADAAHVAKDLATLKALLESGTSSRRS